MRRARAHRPNRIGANPVAVKSFELQGERPGRLENRPDGVVLLPRSGPEYAPREIGFAVPAIERVPEYGAGLA